jgi:hypothetical protein
MCRNVRSIEWHQKTYNKISWDYPFKQQGQIYANTFYIKIPLCAFCDKLKEIYYARNKLLTKLASFKIPMLCHNNLFSDLSSRLPLAPRVPGADFSYSDHEAVEAVFKVFFLFFILLFHF